VLRCGGDRAAAAFALVRARLSEVYDSIARASAHSLHPAATRTHAPTDGGTPSPSSSSSAAAAAAAAAAAVARIHEALLSVTCKYLSCAGLLPAATVARLAKKSLHARLRPLASVPVAAPGVGGACADARRQAAEVAHARAAARRGGGAAAWAVQSSRRRRRRRRRYQRRRRPYQRQRRQRAALEIYNVVSNNVLYMF